MTDSTAKKILILSGSPKKNGNTAALIEWFLEGVQKSSSEVEIVNTAFLTYKSMGCTSCRQCQKRDRYGCVIDDEARPVLDRMMEVDVIVMATPLYFFSPSAQMKLIFDRMFSLYKWDNDKGTMETPLKGKTFALIASAYEDLGMELLEGVFALTAEYSGMVFESLLVPFAGVSGDILNKKDIKEKAIKFGERISN